MFYKKIIMVTSLVLMCGCALQTSKPDSNAVNQPNSEHKSSDNRAKVEPAQSINALELLNYYDLYSNHDAETQKAMLNELNQALTREPNNLLLRMKLSGILVLPTNRYRDPVKAQQQLQSIIQTYSLGRAETALMGLLYEFTQDSTRQQQKLRDEIKKNEMLEKKLNDLKNIERTMIQRNIKPESQ